jgi:hypothetical protein
VAVEEVVLGQEDEEGAQQHPLHHLERKREREREGGGHEVSRACAVKNPSVAP